MTAPNVVPPNGGPGDSASIKHMEDADFAKFLELPKTHPTPEVVPVVQPRDTDGKFIAKEKVLDNTTLVDTSKATVPTESAVAAKPEAASPDAVPTEAAKEPVEAQPEGEEKPVEPVKPPLTKFQVTDAEGKVTEAPPILLNYKVDGKMVEKVPLEKVVHLAQQATYNARQVQELSSANQAGDQQLTQAQQTIQEYERSIARMFEDDSGALFLRARELHQASNSPEKRVEAAEAQARQVQQNYQQQMEQAQVAQFIQGTIQPALEEMVKEYPSVTHDDILGRIALGSKAFEVNGRIPAANLPRVAHFLNTDVANWVATVHEQRSQASMQASQTLNKERAAVQAKQKEMGKALAPVGATAATAPTPPKITRARDILNDPMFGGPQ